MANAVRARDVVSCWTQLYRVPSHRGERETIEGFVDMKRLRDWLYRLFHSGLCPRCYAKHINEFRDVQWGDYWNCRAGKHGYDR